MGLWQNRAVLVTGGASFIGSHLTDSLVERGATVRVVDDLSSGKIENIESLIAKRKIEFIQADLREPGVARDAVRDMEYVFHLAADHGGRGYVDLHQAGPGSNLFLDGLIFAEARRAKVGKVVFASSGCVYPNYLQGDPGETVYLTEDLVKPPYDADNLYGWAKLMAELTLKAYYKELGMKSASVRYFTVYGPRGVENHAVIAMIAKALIRQEPFEVWGDGTQVRNWTYVDDIVRGTVLAAEKIHDGTAVNLGTMERITVMQAVKLVFEYTGHGAQIELHPEMPTGPLNRVADNSLARELLGWAPEVNFREGLKKTQEWYFATKCPDEAAAALASHLTER
jgi:nucleoside-diphosphate-sugar epimerase